MKHLMFRLEFFHEDNLGGSCHGDSLPDVRQQLDEVVCGDFAAVLAEERRELPLRVQAALRVFEHLSAPENKQSLTCCTGRSDELTFH